MRISTGNFDFIFFSELRPFWTYKLGQNERHYSTQFVSATPLKPHNRISWNFVVMKDIMCRCAYPLEILIQFFFSELRSFWTSKFDKNERYSWNSWSDIICELAHFFLNVFVLNDFGHNFFSNVLVHCSLLFTVSPSRFAESPSTAFCI